MSSSVNNMVNVNTEFNQAVGKQKGSALDKDAFMLLLVTQFKYQDPLNPMEDKDFIAQLSQFSSLEQLMNLNEGMTGLTNANLSQQMINATSYIGKNVDATGRMVSKTTDKTTGDPIVSNFRYAIGETSAKGIMNIYDSEMNLIHTEAIPAQTAGTYDFPWHGQGLNAIVPDGVYEMRPVFYNADGEIIQFDSVVDGKVNGVITDAGVTYLTLEDGRNIPLSEVRRVTADVPKTETPKPETPAPDGGTGGDTGGTGGDTGGTGGTGGDTGDTGGTGGDTGGTGGTGGDTGDTGGTGGGTGGTGGDTGGTGGDTGGTETAKAA